MLFKRFLRTSFTQMAEEQNNSSFENLKPSPSNTGLNFTLIVFSTVLFCTGLVGNIATIVIIRIRDDFHSVTHTTIGLLAFVDLVAVFFRGILLVHTFNAAEQNWKLTLPSNSFNVIIAVNCMTLICSGMHVVILVRLRYKLLAFPIEGLNIKPRSIAYQCLLAWITSGILGTIYGCSIFLNTYDIRIFEIVTSILLCLCTVLPIVTYHILKIREIQGGITQRENTVRSMNKMVTAISAVQMLSTTSPAIRTILLITFDSTSIYMGWTVQLLLLMNHVMNPIFFFYFSMLCRRGPDSIRNNTETSAQRDTRL